MNILCTFLMFIYGYATIKENGFSHKKKQQKKQNPPKADDILQKQWQTQTTQMI